MKNILIIFDPITQKNLVSNLITQMRERGLEIDAFNSYRWEYVDTLKDIPFLYRRLRHFLFVRYVGTIIRRLFQVSLLLRVSSQYDFIDVHFFWRAFVPYIEKLKKPYKISIWGSDFYRELPSVQEKKRKLYENARLIQVETDDVKDDVALYDSLLEEKIVVCNFGVDILDSISKSLSGELVTNEEKKNRIVVTIGYNGSRGQQHKVLIEAINNLPTRYKQNIFVYVPATYGLSIEYKKELLTSLSELQVPYRLFESYLSEVELAQLRKESDIVLNAQITDTLNASLIQHLYAGGILIVGEWLPYGIYDRNNIYYIKSKKDEFSSHLKYCLDHFEECKHLAEANQNKILEFATWDAVSDKQYAIFQQFINS